MVRCGVVLAGGRSQRMGQDKLALRLAGNTLLARAARAVAAVIDPQILDGGALVIAGPQPAQWDGPRSARFVVEDPPFGGPVAGIATALAQLEASVAVSELSSVEVILIAGDLADPDRVVAQLDDAAMGPDGVVLQDSEGWPQYLAGRYRLPALLQAVKDLDSVRDVSVRRLMRPLQLAQIIAQDAVVADIDTPEAALLRGVEGITDFSHNCNENGA